MTGISIRSGLAGMLLLASNTALAATACSGGTNWVAGCAAGTEQLAVSLVFGLDTDLDPFNTTDVQVRFDGHMTVARGAPYESVGSPAPGYLDRIDTEIVALHLTGSTPFVSGWTFRAGSSNGLAPTLGFISEMGDDQFPTARFDMVFEIDGTPWGTLHHNGSFFFSTVIGETPEVGAVYKHTGCCFGTLFDLFDSNNVNVLQVTDQFGTDFATIGRPELTITAVVPLPAAFWLLAGGLSLLLAARRRSGVPHQD